MNIFLNNIFFFLNDANLCNYADDSTLYAYNKNLETVICNLRQEFSVLSNWFYDNYMMLNPGKCRFMLFGVKENEQFDLICNDITLKRSSDENIFGVTIDNKLSFDEHIINICKTANKKSQRSQQNKSLYETKSKGNIINILHNLSFQLLSVYLDVLLQKIY